MEYPGPARTDFHNVRSLNGEFLQWLGRRSVAAPPLKELPTDLAKCLAGLRLAERERLAATPFLLFSFRERDDDFWSRLLQGGGTPDLLAATTTSDDAELRIIAAGLGFVWQLARQNAYATRLICGASLHWCEQLAEKTLVDVMNVAAVSPHLLKLRAADNRPLWHKLLNSGIRAEREVRHAAHISALQCVLTSAQRSRTARPALAARAGLSPSRRVAGRTRR